MLFLPELSTITFQRLSQPLDTFFDGVRWLGDKVQTHKGLSSSVANLIVSLEPAFTALVAYFLLGERLNATQVIGSLIILAGVIDLRVDDNRAAKSLTTTSVSVKISL